MSAKEPKAASRKGKLQLGGHFDIEDALTIKEVIARVGRKRLRTLSLQDAVFEALSDWCAKEGVILPSQANKDA
jgi:hypothetical protein